MNECVHGVLITSARFAFIGLGTEPEPHTWQTRVNSTTEVNPRPHHIFFKM